MGLLLQALDRLLPDPPPPLVFAIGDRALLGVRRSGPEVQARAERPLPPPGGEAVDGPAAALESAVESVLRELEPVPGPHAAVLLPDGETRLAVFEFDRLPRRGRELRRAVQERFSKSLPFDARSARVAYRVQGGSLHPSVLATAASEAYVRQCEAAFEKSGLLPDHVGLSTAFALNLVETDEMTLAVKLGGQALTMVAVEGAVARLVRRIAVPEDLPSDPAGAVAEVLPDVFPTLVYIEENLGTPVSGVVVAGFDDLLEPALEVLRSELDFPVRPLVEPETEGAPCDAGLLGYLRA